MQNLKIVTTSWDDGDPNDIRLADLLRERGLPATFYVPISGYKGGRTLGGGDLKALCSEGFEIGAHGVSDRSLPGLSGQKLDGEVRSCKEILEQSLGREIYMFCYPNGRYNAEVIRSVKNAGYRGARTTRMLSLNAQFPHFEMPTTLQAYPHVSLAYLRNQGRAKSISGLTRYFRNLPRLESWIDLGKTLFDQVLQHGGIWHIYGHSWEIEELGIWDDLRKLLDYVSHSKGVAYATNGDLVSLLTNFNSPSSADVPQALKRHGSK